MAVPWKPWYQTVLKSLHLSAASEKAEFALFINTDIYQQLLLFLICGGRGLLYPPPIFLYTHNFPPKAHSNCTQTKLILFFFFKYCGLPSSYQITLLRYVSCSILLSQGTRTTIRKNRKHTLTYSSVRRLSRPKVEILSSQHCNQELYMKFLEISGFSFYVQGLLLSSNL